MVAAIMKHTYRGEHKFRVEDYLQYFASEYSHRQDMGVDLPVSFRAFGAFVNVKRKPGGWHTVPRPQKEHLFDLLDFVDFVSSSDAPGKPVEIASCSQNAVYVYDVLDGSGDYEILLDDGTPVIVKSLFFRREHMNVYCGALCGVKLSREELHKDVRYNAEDNRKGLPLRHGVNTPLQVPGVPGYQRTLYAVELDLLGDVVSKRSAFLESKDTLTAYTDDLYILRWFDAEERESQRKILDEHTDALSIVKLTAFLPDYFAFKYDMVMTEKVAVGHKTRFKTKRVGRKKKKKVVKEVVYRLVPAIRVIREGPKEQSSGDIRLFTPPEYRVEVSGHWRIFYKNPNSIGHDQYGNPIKGKTWVKSHEKWKSKPVKPKVVLIKQPLSTVSGKASESQRPPSQKEHPLPPEMFTPATEEEQYLERRKMTPAVRMAILRRDGFRCQLCGVMGTDPGVALEVDHIIPVPKGGKTEFGNLQTLCRRCNLGKSDDVL